MDLLQGLEEFTRWGEEGRYSPQTVRTYRDLIQRFIAFTGNKPIEELSITDITAFSVHLRRKGYMDSSRCFHIVAVRQFVKYFFLKRVIQWDYQVIQVPKYVSKSHCPAEPDEARAMIDKFRGDTFISLRNKAIISFLYSSGLRVSEVCGLDVKDLRFKDGYGLIISKKNRLRRMIFWDERTEAILRDYLTIRSLWATTSALFISMDRRTKGGRLTTRSVERFVEQCRLRVEITPHSFRHGLGMRAVKANVHPRYIQQILGHKNINSSQIYMQYYDGDVVKAYKKIKQLS